MSRDIFIPSPGLLLPCPFCGCEDALEVVEDCLEVVEGPEPGAWYWYQVRCPLDEGGCGASSRRSTSSNEVMDAWNMRAEEEDDEWNMCAEEDDDET